MIRRALCTIGRVHEVDDAAAARRRTDFLKRRA
jgi:hypothetical protein